MRNLLSLSLGCLVLSSMCFAQNTLTGSPFAIPITTGGNHTFSLDAGTTNANRLYWIFGSVTGTSPGVTLGSAIGSVHIQLNPDIWTDYTIALTNYPDAGEHEGYA